MNLQQKLYVQSKILPKVGEILPGQCQCVRDKFHVWHCSAVQSSALQCSAVMHSQSPECKLHCSPGQGPCLQCIADIKEEGHKGDSRVANFLRCQYSASLTQLITSATMQGRDRDIFALT